MASHKPNITPHQQKTNNQPQQSLRLIPAPAHPTTTTPQYGAPSAPGVHDTLRSNLSLTSPAPKTLSTSEPQTSTHPLEARLTRWRAQQDTLKMEMLRREFGIAEPVRRGMELAIVRGGEWRPACLGGGMGGSLHSDILSGRDSEVGWEDVFFGGEEGREGVDFHGEMERGFGMGW